MIGNQVLLYAGLYAALHNSHGWDGLNVVQPEFKDLLHFSAVNFTTLGLSQDKPVGAFEIISAFEALAGFMTITWSATFTYSAFRKTWQH